jgi:hypothetical protein
LVSICVLFGQNYTKNHIRKTWFSTSLTLDALFSFQPFQLFLAEPLNAKSINKITVGTGVPTFPTLCIYLHNWLERLFAKIWRFQDHFVDANDMVCPNYPEFPDG